MVASPSTTLLVEGRTPGCPQGEGAPSPEGKTLLREIWAPGSMGKDQAWLLITSGSALTTSFGCLTWQTLANKEEECPRFPVPAGLLLFQGCHRITESESLRLGKFSKVIECKPSPDTARSTSKPCPQDAAKGEKSLSLMA